MTRPIIFLDCDGVMNNARTWATGSGLYRVDPECVEVLRSFVEEIDAEVVISSTWRITCSRVQMIELLGPWLAVRLHEQWRTPGGGGRRGPQITEWFKVSWLLNMTDSRDGRTHPHVIFDDDSDFEPKQPLVLVSRRTGLNSDSCEAARRLLRTQAT